MPDSFPFAFANDVTSDSLLQPEDISGSELWFLPPSSPLALPPLPPSTPVDPDQYIGRRPAEIANWHSHFGLLRRIADGDDDVAIVFEDDIDMEWDLERRLRSLWKFLPKKWDLVMLGMFRLALRSRLCLFVVAIQAIVFLENTKRNPFMVLLTYTHPLTPLAHMHTLCQRRVPGVSFGSYDHPSSHIPYQWVSVVIISKLPYLMLT
jgi:hypothetical protein